MTFKHIFIIPAILILLSIYYIECSCSEGEICESNIIRMPIVNSMKSFYMAENFQSPCGQYMCMNGGLCQINPYNSIPTCMCKSPFYGNRCEYQSQQNNIPIQSNNLCRVFNDRNMNICQNGGQCVFVADGKVACLCPTTHKGLFCELPVYLPCNGDPSKICHRDYGRCAVNGSCICIDGYTGPKCDKVEACKKGYCLNGATCQEINEEPYSNCSCPPNFFGRRCEIFGIKLDNGTIIKFNRSCNLTLSIFNQGGYTANYRIEYDAFGKKQVLTSGDKPSGQTYKTTVPFYAENVVIIMLTSLGNVVHVDRSLPSGDLPCQKCYKIWGVVGSPKWDYIRC